MPRKKKSEEKIPLLQIAVNALTDKKAEDIVTLELSKLPGAICDYFIICSGNSRTHVESLFESVREAVKKESGLNIWHSEGMENAEWVLIDYFDIVIHIFQPESRLFYQLEDLWADAPSSRF